MVSKYAHSFTILVPVLLLVEVSSPVRKCVNPLDIKCVSFSLQLQLKHLPVNKYLASYARDVGNNHVCLDVKLPCCERN
jgi:hypothetical protein